MVRLFEGVKVRGWMFPLVCGCPRCQYSAIEGVVQAWHQVHLGSWAINKAGLIITEATAVVPEGRISPADSGLWNDEQEKAWEPILSFSHAQGVPIAIQLAHAGRKASHQGSLCFQALWSSSLRRAAGFQRLPRLRPMKA